MPKFTGRGFTLIELLVVISIIAILSAVGLVSYNNIRKGAMDAKIKSDINAIAKAYEQKFDPTAGGGQGAYKTISSSDFAGGAIPTGTSDKTYGGFTTGEAEGFRICSPLISNAATSCTVESPTCYCKTSTQGAGNNLGYTPGGASGGDFSYRAPVTINSGGALTNFQVAVSFNTQSLIGANPNKMKSDCTDLRVTDSNGVAIPYWIEPNTCDTPSTLVWVKPASLVTGENTIYFYYGNASATSLADANIVFELYDDFNDNSINSAKWSAVDPVDANGNKIGLTTTETGGVLRRSGTPTANDKWSNFNSIAAPSNFRVTEFKIRFNTITVDSGVSFAIGNSLYINNAPVNSWQWARWTGSAWTDNVASTLTTGGSFSRIKIITRPAGASIYENNVLKVTGTQPISTGTSTSVFSTVSRQANSTYSVDIDDVMVRKYATSDPTSSVGTEQSP